MFLVNILYVLNNNKFDAKNTNCIKKKEKSEICVYFDLAIFIGKQKDDSFQNAHFDSDIFAIGWIIPQFGET